MTWRALDDETFSLTCKVMRGRGLPVAYQG
jgi:hypothetical protein